MGENLRGFDTDYVAPGNVIEPRCEDDGRQQFEAWISSEPYAESIQRVTSDWYRSPKVNLAWAALKESRRVSGVQSVESEK